MLNRLQQFEDFVERLMEGTVGRIFRTSVQPAEIARRLERAMDAQQLATPEGPIVPNDFLVRLHPDDFVQFADFADSLSLQLEEWLLDIAEERDYGFVDQVRVRLVGDPAVPRRQVVVEARIAELPADDFAGRQAWQRTEVYRVLQDTGNVPRAFLRVVEGPLPGETYLIRKRVTTLGRALENDIVLEALDVSRRHARIEYADGQFVIIDQGSTNGTYVNGVRVERAPLRAGDRVALGTVVLEFSLPGA
ncbi:Glycogen accumulation regulator GarA [bacterium HR27]|nr:Glycogen accumulation regulator GarA [bacterium HR27]